MNKLLLNGLIITLMQSSYGQVSNFPYLEDFESFNLCQATCPAVCSLTGGWTNSQDDYTDWIAFSGPTPTPYTGPDQDLAPGNPQGKYLYLEASEGCSRGTEANLISPLFNFSSLSQPSLEFGYHMYGEGMGELHLDADTSSGWITDIIPPLRNNTKGWKKQSICLSGFAGKSSVRFRLRGVTGLTEQSDIALDGFMIREARNHDVYLKAIEINGCGQGAQTPVSIVFGNLGRQDAMNLTASFSVDGGAFSPLEFIPGTFASCTTGFYTFQATADFSAPGPHEVTAVVSLFNPVDQNPANDTLKLEVESIPLVQHFPYEEGFEHDAGGWRAYGVNSSWAWGSPSGQYISAAGAGGKAWVTNLSGAYNNNEYAFLESPCLDFSGLATDPVFSFLHTFRTEDELDVGWVEYSTDAGQTWFLLGNRSSGLENWYNSSWQEVWTGTSQQQGGWRRAAFRLTGMAGKVVRLRFVMYADGSIRDEGFGIDEVRIVYPRDAAVITILSPGDTCGAVRSTEEEVKVKIRNLGYYDLTHISLTFRVDGAGPFVPNEGIQGRIPGGASFVHTFRAAADLSTPGPHHITAAVLLSGDNDFSNNILVRSAGNFPLPTFDLGPDTVICGRSQLTLDPGKSGTAYLWSTGASTPTLSVSSGGLYVLELTDQQGCSARDSINVVTLPPLDFSYEYLEDVKCYGDSSGTFKLKARGGIAPYQWVWPTGNASGTLSHLPAGLYPFTLIDDFGCELKDSVRVQQPDSIQIHQDALRNAGCPVDSSGFIFVSIHGGTPPYSYLWSNGSTTEDLPRIPEGKYILSLIDDNGCTQYSEPFEIITQDTLPRANFNFVISGATVRFVDSSLNAINYYWSFGDGASAINRANPVYTYQENGNYQVQLIASNSCGTDTFIQNIRLSSVGVDPSHPERVVRIFPNPAKPGSLLFLEGDDAPWEAVEFRLQTLSGQIVLREKWPNLPPGFRVGLTLPPDLVSGVYLLSLRSRQGTLYRRLALH